MFDSIKKLVGDHPTSKAFQKEIHTGLKLLEKFKDKKVTVFGSHRTNKNDFFYQDAISLGKELAKKKYVSITGGGPGIMSAIAIGASDQKGICLGMRAELLTQEHTGDEFYSNVIYFNFLAARKYVMASGSDFLIFYPGGLGTLDEFFEYLVQVQLGMLENKKIICIGAQYWNGLISWLDSEVKTSNYLIDKNKDLRNINIVENFSEAVSIIDNSR